MALWGVKHFSVSWWVSQGRPCLYTPSEQMAFRHDVFQKKKNTSWGMNNSRACWHRPGPSTQAGWPHPPVQETLGLGRRPPMLHTPPDCLFLSQVPYPATCCHCHWAINSSDKRSVVKPQKLIFHMAAKVSFLKSKSDSITSTWPDLSPPNPAGNTAVLPRPLRALESSAGPTQLALPTALSLASEGSLACVPELPGPGLVYTLREATASALFQSWAGSSPLSQEPPVQTLLPGICHICGRWFSHWVVSDSCDPMDCSPPGSSVHGIFQAKTLEWVTISFSRGSSPSRDWTHVSWNGRHILYPWATWEAKFMFIHVSDEGLVLQQSTAQEGRVSAEFSCNCISRN